MAKKWDSKKIRMKSWVVIVAKMRKTIFLSFKIPKIEKTFTNITFFKFLIFKYCRKK